MGLKMKTKHENEKKKTNKQTINRVFQMLVLVTEVGVKSCFGLINISNRVHVMYVQQIFLSFYFISGTIILVFKFLKSHVCVR